MNNNRQRLYRRLLHESLRDARIKAGLRQEDVALRLGLPQSFVSKYETGERQLDLADLKDICEALGISLLDLVRKIEESVQ